MIISDLEVKYNSNEPLNGAFAHLQIANKKENISQGVVTIKTSTNLNNFELPVIKRDFEETYWHSDCENGSWYEVDFLHNHFYLESYVIRAYSQDYFSNWQVIGSNDGKHYDIVDEKTDFPEPLPVTKYNLHFTCKAPKARRTFRIVTNGKRLGGSDYCFYLHRLEFFGKFFYASSCKTPIKKSSQYKLSVFLYIMITS